MTGATEIITWRRGEKSALHCQLSGESRMHMLQKGNGCEVNFRSVLKRGVIMKREYYGKTQMRLPTKEDIHITIFDIFNPCVSNRLTTPTASLIYFTTFQTLHHIC